jgi:L-histidine N-alpha-methyltransferase
MAATLEIQVRIDPDDRRRALVEDVRRGLLATPKSIPPTWFYDERGSELFEDITRVPEYYPTRIERAILSAHAADIVAQAGVRTLVELGSGSSEKTRVLLDAMAAAGSLDQFVPLDVSKEILLAAAEDIRDRYGVPVVAVVGDFHRHLSDLPGEGGRLVAFLGSTIGNLTPPERHHFLLELRSSLEQGDVLLLGTDLEKDPARLEAAYDDAAGVTAAFNLNVLAVLNQELGAQFDLDDFEHIARWNPVDRRIEMRLRAKRDHVVDVKELDLALEFTAGEEILTEVSSKFTPQLVAAELAAAGFAVEQAYNDPAIDFQLTLGRVT